MSLLCVRCKRKKARLMQPVEFNAPRWQSNDSPRSPNASMHNNEVHEPRRKENMQHMYTNMSALNKQNHEWEYPREKVRIKKYIGKGAFVLVAKAFVDDLGIVAIKIPKVKARQSNKEALLAEYELMKQLQHPNIIRLMGAVTLSDPIMVMFEYIPYGDLLGFLKRSRGLDDQYFNDPDVKPTSPLTPQQLLKFAGEIADGMTYLEANKIIHRDLAARNVLLGEEETCKITDFGMARDVQQNDIYFKSSRGRLPVKWTAIESLLYGICTTESDVWSYGIVLYEIFTIGGNPYPNIQDHRIPYMLKDNYRMPQPVHLDDEIYALMCECWQNDPNDRPTFEAISSTIRRLQRCHKVHKPEWEYPREKVRIEKYIGKGAFGVVAKAFVDDLGIVAIKIPKVEATESNKEDLLAEYELVKQLQHPNIIRLMGAVTLSDPIMVMFEYIPYGDLLGFLKRSRGLDDQYFNDPDIKPSSSLTSEQLLKFSGEIADGMAYLEAWKIIHRDLAARNVLVGEEETCKITDFGMARDVQQNDIYFKRSRGRLPVKWTAIESLLYGICTTQSDVWSYGIVLYEIFTIGGKPYPDIQGHRIPYVLKNNYRMPQPVHLDDEIYALMCECWQNDPNDRPTFEAISSTIRRLQRCHKEIIYMNVYDDNLYGNVEDLD
ncbi:uncharacterized protein [Montipora capricornis]|uniref:uncharacterized protein isoform X2 n=1 Tax=Montipora capricornis TaxID=246305 RepID=UPI0035F182E5